MNQIHEELFVYKARGKRLLNEFKHRIGWKGLTGKERKQSKQKLSEQKFYAVSLPLVPRFNNSF